MLDDITELPPGLRYRIEKALEIEDIIDLLDLDVIDLIEAFEERLIEHLDEVLEYIENEED